MKEKCGKERLREGRPRTKPIQLWLHPDTWVWTKRNFFSVFFFAKWHCSTQGPKDQLRPPLLSHIVLVSPQSWAQVHRIGAGQAHLAQIVFFLGKIVLWQMRATSTARRLFKSHHGILSDTGLPCTKQYPTGAERADGRSEVPRHVSRADGCHWLCGPGRAPKSSISPTNSAWPLQGSLIDCFPGALLLGANLLWSISAASLTSYSMHK